MKVTLSLTHRCNLACGYCYAGHSRKPDMELSTAQRSIDTALGSLHAGKTLFLGLFGGEPLLRFDLVREITVYARRRAAEMSLPISIGITTNGTLVSPAVLDFVSQEGISLCFSIDGPEDVHDRSRRHRDGRGSFPEVVGNLQRALERLGVVEVNAVLGPDTLADVPRTVSFFTDLGVRVIHLSPHIRAAWPRQSYRCLQDVYAQLAEHYIACYERGVEIAVNLIDSKAVLFVKGGYSPSDMCAMGDGEWAVAPSGNLYPCERFIGEDSDSTWMLGDIWSGFDPARRCALRLKRGNHREECATCPDRRFCMNWCGCTNYYLSGRTDIPAPVLCAMEKAAINAARYVFESLVTGGNDLFADHLFNYVSAEAQCTDRAPRNTERGQVVAFQLRAP
ncbi:MAG: radical SAM protein [Chromatiaceae bacterium]|jgi:uncharacterized protein